MQLLQLASFNGVAANSIATAQIPSYNQSLGKVTLELGGGATKANTTRIVGKIGSRPFFGPISGAQLDSIMKYRGQFDLSTRLTIDLCDKRGLTLAEREVGAIDLPGLGGQPVFIEYTSSGAAPTVEGRVGYVGRQFRDVNSDGKTTRNEQGRQNQLITKLIPFTVPSTGTRQVFQMGWKGAQIKRIYLMYAGTDWTASADGNLHTVECKLNGVAVHERIGCLDNRFHQQEYGCVPQSRMYVVDFVADSNMRAALDTRGARSFELGMDLTAADTITGFAEVLDLPDNL